MTREFGVPTDYSVPADISMADNVFAYGEEEPGRVVFQVATGRAVWRDVTAAEFAATVSAVGKGLIASGVEAGDRVAIMASTRYEWTVLEYAVWAVGGCTVAIYDSSSAEQTKWILEDSGTSLLVVETPAHRALVAEIEDGLPGLVETLQLESGAVDELRARGAGVSDDMLRDRRALVDSAAPATLIYTSGTTGKPKGVPLSHANLKAESVILYSVFEGVFFEGNRTLVFLPMAHIFAQLVTSVAFDGKVVVAHTADWSTLVEQFAAFRPDFLTAVPRVFEKVYDSARQRAHDGGKGRIFDAAAATAIAYSKALDNGRPGIALKARHALFDRLVYARLRSAIGGRCGTAVSAGGPLGERLGHFFRGAGIPVYEGWGLTETTAAITVNNAAHQRIGSVGRPIPGHTVRVADDGELLVRGPVVFEGYRNNATANEEGFTDGWFRTGDLGTIDEQGYVTITGRKKEIIVTAGGKNVSPMVLEDSLRANPLISQCMVVGDGKPFIGALITLDAETLTGWKERNGLSADLSADHLIDNSALYAEIESAVTEANTKVSRAESIRKFRILPTDWTTEAGELTPKMSLKRSVILKQYAAEVDKIYNSEVG
ncbi:long-chain fatty acid--CoA ligase [Nocardia sp. BMG51109]|uniref:AMP-dependent synthetase/ligase n=1 Tax=Nocardia sp. BMG51109 TaxID=1056816 RepID=UPI0004670DBE|nr:long-chain fatty acid--CoA ligase [Nocardia sp. BMG51109]